MTSTLFKPPAPLPPAIVRVVSYNIMTGGEGRADPLAEVVLGQRADVVGIHEADDMTVLRRFAWRWRMDFIFAEAADGLSALFTRFRIVDSSNISLLHRTTMPILDATLNVGANGTRQELTLRIARVTTLGEADRMATKLGTGTVRQPMVMLMSHEPPVGKRVIDGKVFRATEAIPNKTHAPPRMLDDVLIRPDVRVRENWIERDRLAYYASDHLPAGAEIEVE